MTYQDQIKSPKWQKKRLEVLELHGLECQSCGDTESTLNVHHSYYKKGHKIWEYETSELECLCENCHKEAHELDDKIRLELSRLGQGDKQRVLGYINAIQSDATLEPKTYEYCQGVADYLFIKEKPLPDSNTFYDCVAELLSTHEKQLDFYELYREHIVRTKHA